MLQGTYCRYYNDRRRFQLCHPALDIQEFLRIDPKRITWKRVVDMNDRQLRNIEDGLGRRVDGVTREDGYDITVASEIMAVLCLARNITDLKERLSKIIVGLPMTRNRSLPSLSQ